MSRRLLVYSSKLHRGGAEKHLVLLLNELALMGYEIHLVVSQAGGSYEKMLSKAVRLHYPTLRISSYSFALFFGALTLWRVMRKVRPVISYSIQDGPNIINLLVAKVAAGNGTSHVIEVQNNPENELSKSGLLKLYYQICKILYPKSNGFISLSEGVQSAYLRAVPNLMMVRRRVIHNIGFVKAVRDRKRAKDERDWRLLAVGRLTKQKDYPTLIKAVKTVKSKLAEVGRPFRLLLDILGDGELEYELRRLVKEQGLEENVFFHGFVSDPDTFYMSADLFVLSSTWEGFGNVIVEAMSWGVPVISTNCDFGPSEIINNPGVDGLLVPVGDSYAIAHSILKLMNDSDMYDKLSLEGYKRASDFSSRNIASRYHESFESFMHG